MKPQVKNMVGKTYIHGGHAHFIKSIKPTSMDKDVYMVITDLNTLKASEEELMADFSLMITPEEKQNKLELHQNVKTQVSSMQSLEDILMGNITKVTEDPKYIDQAKSVNESVKNIIDIKKAQLEIFRILKDN